MPRTKKSAPNPDDKPDELVGQREFARRMGVTHTAVQKAIRDERLTKSVHRHPSGRFKGIAAELGAAEWKKNTDPSPQRARGSRRGGSKKGRGKGKARQPKKPDPALFPDVDVKDTPKDAPAPDEPAPGGRTLPSVRTDLISTQAEIAKLDLAVRARKLVQAGPIQEHARRTWAQVRQTLENIADTLAGELAMIDDPKAIRRRLRDEIRAELTRLADAAERGKHGAA